MNDTYALPACPVCGSAMVRLSTAETLPCIFCGKIGQVLSKCSEGHFICEDCHHHDAKKVIEDTVFASELRDPLALAELLMSHPNIPMMGCEHAFIAAGALMTSLKNSPYGKGKVADREIREVFDRTARQAVNGFCGLTGVCGIAPALGACFSVFLGSYCGADTEQKITMEAVLRISRVIADLTGPSCCKAYVRAALAAAVTVFGERFGILLPVRESSIVCSHSEKHPHGCREEKCPYYHKPAKDIFADSIHLPVMACRS